MRERSLSPVKDYATRDGQSLNSLCSGLGLRQQWVSVAGAQKSEGPEKKVVARFGARWT